MIGKQRKYSSLFKENAVLLSYKRSGSLTDLAKELNISPSKLTDWRQLYEKFGKGSFPGSGGIRVKPENQRIFELERKLKQSEQRFEIYEKGIKYLLKGKHSIYIFMKENEKIYSVRKMCQIFEIHAPTYRRWRNQIFSESAIRRRIIKEEIMSLYYEFNKEYGALKITREIRKKGYKISVSRVAFFMKEMNLYRKVKRKFIVTTDSKHGLFISPNLLNRDFCKSTPSKVWVSDITYIQTTIGFIYLTIIMDVYDRKIIGWSLSNDLSTEKTTLKAWEMAIERREITYGLIFHSDRGAQYANKAFTNKLDSYQCIRKSMCRKSDHEDNAMAESFFCTFKRELIFSQTKLLTKKEMEIEIFDFIENWYNKKRIHSGLNLKTIEEFNADD